MEWVIIVCSILIIGALVGCCFWIKSVIKSSLIEFGEIVEDKITNASDIPQVALDNYIGEIVSSVKMEIKDIKLGKKVAEKIAEDIKSSILEKLGENISTDVIIKKLEESGYLKSEEKNDNLTTKNIL